MIRIQKRHGKKVLAYQLGSQSPALQQLVKEGRLIACPDGSFEVMSQEAVHGKGEKAFPGDFVKIDAQGYPYPNSKTFFENNHRHLQGDEYEQIPRPLEAWPASEPVCEEVRFLVEHKGLVIDPRHPDRYLTAPLWGTLESATRDAVVVFYHIQRDESGAIVDADFNFVARSVFETEYEIVSGS